MPDGNPIIIGFEGNTGSTGRSSTRLTRGGPPSPTSPPFTPMFTIHTISGGDAIRGETTTNVGVEGISNSFRGVHGNSNSGEAVRGDSASSTGVRGNSGSDTGVIGTGGTRFPAAGIITNGVGVVGVGTASGVQGTSVADRGVGVSGISETGQGVYGECRNVDLLNDRVAGFFRGSVTVVGFKNFKMDHPLDPENRYLLHTCVESSEPKNVYDGVAQLDEDGAAWVDLPEWFEALNGDFRYQLTAVGGSAPNLHVAEEVSENRFKMAGGEEGMKVCWQVTGSRKDPWAAANPFEVEQEKREEERGRYLEPSLYDAPEEQRVLVGPPIAAAGEKEQRPPQPSGIDFARLEE